MKNCFDWISKRKAYKMTGISADDVRKRVARKLGDAAEEEERTRIRMKKRLVLSVVLAALFLISAAAATSYHISKLLPKNIAQVQDSIQTEPVQKTLGEFEITVLESLCSENNTYLSLSVHGLTDKAKGLILNDGRGGWQEMFDVYVDGEKDAPNRHGIIFQKEESLCTADTIYLIGDLKYPNPEGKPIIIALDEFFLEDNYPNTTVTDTISVPAEKQVNYSFVITPNQKVTAYMGPYDTSAFTSLKAFETQITVNKVSLSQLGLRIEYKDDTECSSPEGCIFMQMADGTIRTCNQLFTPTGGRGDGENNVYYYNANFIKLQDMKNFKALIIGNTAYPLDGGKTYQVKIDQKLKPFLLPVRHEEIEFFSDPKKAMERLDGYGETYQWDAAAQTITITSDVTHQKGAVLQVGTRKRLEEFYPVKDMCDKLGAGYQWDAVGRKVTITYNGRTTVLSVGTSSHPWIGKNNTTEVELRLVEGKPYASWQLVRALGLSHIAAVQPEEKFVVIFP